MTQGIPTTYHAHCSNTALLLVGVITLIAALAGAVALSLAIATTGDDLMPLVLGSLGGFVALFVVLILAVSRRHRWTLQPGALLIEERPLVPLTGRSRGARLGFADIVLLSRVQNGADDMIEVQSRAGARFRMGPAALAGGGLRARDTAGLEAFAAQLREAIGVAGHQAPPLLDGLSFWNRMPGLLFTGLLLALSLGFSGLVLVGIFSGAEVRGPNAGQAAAILVLLPVGVGWMLRKAWRRRQAVLGQRLPRGSGTGG
jgi:hypothetical protein